MVLYHEASFRECSASRCGWNIAITAVVVVTRARLMISIVIGIILMMYHLFAAKEALVLLEGGTLSFPDFSSGSAVSPAVT